MCIRLQNLMVPAIFGNKTSGVGLGTKSAFGSQPPGPTLLLLHTLYLTILSPRYTNPGTVRQTQVLHLYRLFVWFFPPSPLWIRTLIYGMEISTSHTEETPVEQPTGIGSEAGSQAVVRGAPCFRSGSFWKLVFSDSPLSRNPCWEIW